MKHIHVLILVLIAIMCGCTDINRAKTYLLPPTSLGLEEVAPKVFVNKEMSPIQREEFSKIVTEARKNVAVFLGDVISGPQILACSTEDCFVGLGGEATWTTPWEIENTHIPKRTHDSYFDT